MPLPSDYGPTNATPYTLISAATTNATVLRSQPCQLFSAQLYNTSGAAEYVKVYDKASPPVVGTDVPVKNLMVPAGTTGAGNNLIFGGIAFLNGVAIATTANAAISDNTAVGAGDLIINFDIK